MSSLADRIRGVIGAPHPEARSPGGPQIQGESQVPNPESQIPGESQVPNPESRDLSPLGGAWRENCFVVDRRWEPTAQHGREEIGALAERLDEAAGDAVLFAGGAARAPFVFFDLETTGLSGGAGTLAFLVGCAWFQPDGGFRTRQFLLTRYTDERPLLAAVSDELARAGVLVSFNGKSFDAPLLETRYLFHRLDWVGGRMPHIDVLHPARQFWKRGTGDLGRAVGARGLGARAFPPSRNASADRRSLGGGGQSEESTCSLVALERHIVGARRVGDVPGYEIPGRYFQFLRSGDARPLGAVLEHNRLDLVTLAALTARLLHLTRAGHDAARDAREALALGRVYARAHRQAQGALSQSPLDFARGDPEALEGSKGGGLDARACAAFRHAVALSDHQAKSASAALVRIDSLRVLALALRRARQFVDAAACWRQLLDMRECPPHLTREATEALAVHHEHRERDLAAAKAFALRSLETGPDPARRDAARHRLARLERKMKVSEQALALLSSPSPPSCGSPTSARRTSS